MGMLPKGFGGKLDYPRETIEGCTIAFCPTCKREFYRNENNKICNMCSMGMVWNGNGEYTYYPGLDKSKQNKDGV